MKKTKIALVSAFMLLAFFAFFSTAKAQDSETIHPFAYGTLISYTDEPGQKIGCLTSGTSYTLKIDFYYTDTQDKDQRITSLTLETNETGTWTAVSFTVTWGYSIDGEVTWHSYPGTGDIDVPYSGKTGIGTLATTDPHATVNVTFPVSGSLGQKFFYRVHFTSYKYVPDIPGNSGNHYFWYDICYPGVPEFSVAWPVMTLLGATLAYAVRRRRLGKH